MADDRRRGLMRAFSANNRTYLLPPLTLIALLFASQLLALSRFRLDYPVVDDWRYYFGRYRMPEALSFEWLFRPAADTLHVTGKLLDWLFFRNLSHDYNLLMTLGFGLFFGGWLLATVALLKATSQDRPVALLSSLLVLCLALAGSPYFVTVSPYQWLEPAIAYHQMLPVLGLTLLGLLCVLDRSRWPRGLAPGLAVAITLFSSFVYSSGAVVLVVFGAAVLAVSELTRFAPGELSNSARNLAAIILVTAAVVLSLHVLMPMQVHDVNPIIDSRRYSVAWPTDASFWKFFIGLFDRAVLSTASGWIPDLRGSLVALFFALPMFWLPVLIVRDRIAADRRSAAIVVTALLAAVLIYALLVSYGRANFGGRYIPQVDELMRPSMYARNRFFFWWITAFLPLGVVAWGLALEQSFSRRAVLVSVPILALLLVLPKTQHPESRISYFQYWSYTTLYQYDAKELSRLIGDDQKAIETGIPSDSGVIWSRRLNMPAREIIFSAQKSGAEFVDRWGLVQDSSRFRRLPKKGRN